MKSSSFRKPFLKSNLHWVISVASEVQTAEIKAIYNSDKYLAQVSLIHIYVLSDERWW